MEHGMKLGRELGFPTANILPAGSSALMDSFEGVESGVYFCRVEQWWALASLGVNATVGLSGGRKFEVHIIDYDGGDLYGETLRVDLIEYIRAQERFDSLVELKDAILGDMTIARGLIKKYNSENN